MVTDDLAPDCLALEEPVQDGAPLDELARGEWAASKLGLDELIDNLLTYHNSGDIGRAIGSLPPLLRPRAVLNAIQSANTSDPHYDDQTIIATALRCVFFIFTPQKAIEKCCQLHQLVDLHCSITGEERFKDSDGDVRRNVAIEEVSKALLEVFKVPSPVSQQKVLVRSPSEAIQRIGEIEGRVRRRVKQHPTDAGFLQGQVVRAWTLVESVLKLSLTFFALHFAGQLPPEFVSRLKKAVPKKASGQIVGLFREVENIFQYGELLAEGRKRRRENRKELDNIDDGEERQRKLEQHKQIEEHKRQYAKSLRNDCWRDFGRESPFEGIIFDDYNKLISEGRSDFAHKLLEDIRRGRNGSDLVLQSLEKAKSLIQNLLDKRAAPRIIVVMGKGRDWYDNPVVWFTDRENIRPDFLPSRETVEWMYAEPSLRFAPFQQVVMMSANECASPDWMEPIIEPVIYPIEDIIAWLGLSNQEVSNQEGIA